MFYVFNYLESITLETVNETTAEVVPVDLTLESRLLAVILLFTLLVAVALLVAFYTEVAEKPTERNLVTGILLGISSTFLSLFYQF